ncbi:TIGR04255 family protein [Reichenbachiella faecimaris]|uniref:TIGR04255 family protein n=1 Tax=Reichenbachiella faecimaris TaxID=692418 RepID=A0A1W2GJ11_REIFA|nr:TIGR04255 family protein [Reichenbachiella faecimaris]SMD36637.1 TIGR04255 family protein [Reichenbachiella faecimaris]
MKKLPKAPLQEVILEIKWELSLDSQSKSFVDPNFNFALGKFHQSIVNDFPVKNQKIPNDIPLQMIPHQVLHQFWSSKNVWPVVQIGPGIISINDTEKNYVWEEKFHPLAESVIEKLVSAYENDIKFKEYSLRYIDVVNVNDYDFSDWKLFLETNFNFSFKNSFNTKGELKDFQFNQSFELKDNSLLHISFSSGRNNKNEEVFVWQTTVSRRQGINQSDLLNWIDEAHTCASNTFKDICKPKFYGSFIN